MNTPNIASIATDISAGINTHVKNIPMFWDLYEGPAPMNWEPGKRQLRHALAATVRHKGQPLVLSGHDLGPLLPHGPANYFLNALKSKRAVIFAASGVVANGKACACVDASQNTALMACGDFSLPEANNESNALHTVLVGLSRMDRVRGDVAIAMSKCADIVNLAISIATMDPSKELGKSEADAWGGVSSGLLGFDPKSTVSGMATSLVGSTLVSWAGDWKEPISIKVAASTPLLAAEAEWSWTPDDGKEARSAKVRLDSASEEVKANKDAEGNWTASHKGQESSSGESWGGPL